MRYDFEMVDTLIEIGLNADETNVEVCEKILSDFETLNISYDDLTDEHKEMIDVLEDKFDITLACNNSVPLL